jgi:subtilisin family serine protease
MLRSRFWILLALCVVLAGAPLLPAHGQDYGGDWGDEDWGDWGDWGDFDDYLDNIEDPADFDNDVDTDFEGDEILALNLSRAGIKAARALGFRVQERRYLRALQFTLSRLRPPRNVNSRTALARLRAADPKGFYDLNLTYALAGEAKAAEGAKAACVGVRCYGHTLIGWTGTACAVRTRVAMIDGGVDRAHPALAGRRIETKRLARGAATAGDIEHGTAVAALLVGASDSSFPGLLPEAELIAADVFYRNRAGETVTDAATIATALDWIAGLKPGVLNISITGPDGKVLRAAINRLARTGVAIVAAAGNLGPVAPAQYPAAYPEVIATTAIDRHLQVYARANRGKYVAFAAPGVEIWTAGPKGAGVFREGTSYAAPFVTAAVALLRAREPQLEAKRLRDKLRQAARDLGPPGSDPTFGWGLVQSGACGTQTAAQ